MHQDMDSNSAGWTYSTFLYLNLLSCERSTIATIGVIVRIQWNGPWKAVYRVRRSLMNIELTLSYFLESWILMHVMLKKAT